jgi:hypothetical protein
LPERLTVPFKPAKYSFLREGNPAVRTGGTAFRRETMKPFQRIGR